MTLGGETGFTVSLGTTGSQVSLDDLAKCIQKGNGLGRACNWIKLGLFTGRNINEDIIKGLLGKMTLVQLEKIQNTSTKTLKALVEQEMSTRKVISENLKKYQEFYPLSSPFKSTENEKLLIPLRKFSLVSIGTFVEKGLPPVFKKMGNIFKNVFLQIKNVAEVRVEEFKIITDQIKEKILHKSEENIVVEDLVESSPEKKGIFTKINASQVELLEMALGRLDVFVQEKLFQKKELEKTQIALKKDPNNIQLQRKTLAFQQKIMEASFSRKVAFAKIAFSQQEPIPTVTDEALATFSKKTLEEIRDLKKPGNEQKYKGLVVDYWVEKHPETVLSTYLNQSVSYVRAMQIADALASIAEKKQNPKEVGLEMNLTEVADALQVSEKDIQTWLCDAEQDRIRHESLSSYAIKDSFSQEDISKIKDLLEYVKENPLGFSKPFSIFKVFSLMSHLDKSSNEDVKTTCEDVMSILLEKLELHKQGALWEMAQSKTTPEELVEVISKKIWAKDTLACEYPNSPFAQTDLTSTPITIPPIQVRIRTIQTKAEELSQMIEKAIALNTEEAMNSVLMKIPQGILHSKTGFFTEEMTFEAKKENLIILKNKLASVITRQQIRLKQDSPELPLFFHATKNMNTAFSITSSGIRPAVASMGYGAFVSTHPAMLRYGGAILGVSERAIFHKTIQGEGQFVYKNPSIGNVFQDVYKERWIGLRDNIGMNEKSNELQKHFYTALSQALYTIAKEIPQVQKEKTISILENHLHELNCMFEFVVTSPKDPSKGSWRVMLDASSGKGRYVPFDENILKTLFEDAKLPEEIKNAFSTVEAKKELFQEIIKNISLLSDEKPTSTTSIEIAGNRGISFLPFYIGMDADGPTNTFWKNNKHWRDKGDQRQALTVGEKKDPTVEDMKITFKKNVNYEKLGKVAKAEIDDYLATHFIPLMEQTIEYELLREMGGGGAQVLQEHIPVPPET